MTILIMTKQAILGFAFILACWIGFSEGQSCSSLPKYVYRADRKSFNDAKNVCNAMGARLAVANTYEEAVLLTNLAQHSQTSFEYTFVGRYYNGKSWVTVDGPLVADSGYVGWMKGEPNYVTSNGKREECGAIGWNALHNDVLCANAAPFICEFYQKQCTYP